MSIAFVVVLWELPSDVFDLLPKIRYLVIELVRLC